MTTEMQISRLQQTGQRVEVDSSRPILDAQHHLQGFEPVKLGGVVVAFLDESIVVQLDSGAFRYCRPQTVRAL